MAVGLWTGLLRNRLPIQKKMVLRIRKHTFSGGGRYMSSTNNSSHSENGRVLYLNSSGRDERSITGETARLFLAKYKALHPNHSIEEVHLWDKNLLSFNLSHVESKMRIAGGEELPEDRSRLMAVQEMARHLLSANKLIISCPMWNFSVPYVLKQYIDCVVQPDLTFRETDKGIEGLVTGRPLLLITSSSDDFSKDPLKKMDFQVPYLKTIFGFIGFRDFRHIYMANTKHHSREEIANYAKQRIDEEVFRF